MASWLRKIFQPKTAATFESNKYDINSKEYKQMKADMKAAGIKFGHKEKVEFKQAVRNGELGTYMDSKEIDAKFSETLGLSLSSKVGKTDATKDVAEAQRLEKAAYTDEDLLNTLKSTNPEIYDKVVAFNKIPLAQPTAEGFKERVETLRDTGEFQTFDTEKNLTNFFGQNPLMNTLDELTFG